MNTTLIVGFDSAWAPNNAGAIVGVLEHHENGSLKLLGIPEIANFDAATKRILEWQKKHSPVRTLILIDQPIIVENKKGQRPVENIVGSPVSKRYGGVQPANKSKVEMFGENAPVRKFLSKFDGPCDPRNGKLSNNCVIETYPALGLIALDWLLDDDHVQPRITGRLPKYNPQNRRKFSHTDWGFVCGKVSNEFKVRKLCGLAKWLDEIRGKPQPKKSDQDCLDACLCLLTGLYLAEGSYCLLIGNLDSGYMVVPHSGRLFLELEDRKKHVKCKKPSFPEIEVAEFCRRDIKTL